MGLSLIEKLAAGLAVGGAVVWFTYKLQAASKTPSPSPVPPTPSPKPSSSKKPMSPTPQPSSLRYSSLPANVIERYNRVKLKSGKGFTKRPMWDVFNNTWARLDYETAAQLLAARGLRFPTAAEFEEVARMPDTLVTPLCNQPADNKMGTKAAWDGADLCIQAAISEAGLPEDGNLITLKTWEDIPPGQETYVIGPDGKPTNELASWLHGMLIPSGKQPGGGFSKAVQNRGRTRHNRRHIDYSQLVYGVEL